MSELKSAWINIYRKRGSDDKFVKFMDSNWDSFISEMDNETYPNKLIIHEKDFGITNDVIRNCI